jgi:hypothetical protein
VQPRAQFFRIEWLDQIVVGPRVEARDDVRAAAARADQDDVHVRAVRVQPNPSAEIGPVERRHHPVDDRQLRGVRKRQVPRRFAVVGDADVETDHCAFARS